MDRTPDDRSPMAQAMAWAARITTISLEMALPGLGGYWIDRRLGTKLVFTLIGVSLGMIVGGWHLMQITRQNGSGGTD